MSTYITKRASDLGIKVVDATEPLQVNVKQADIDKAQQKNSKCCAFVRACEREMPIEAAFFFRSTAYLEYPDKIVRYKLPPSVEREIVAFDRSKDMEPGVYQLSAVCRKQTLKAKAKYRATLPRGKHSSKGILPKGRKQSLIHRTTNVRTAGDPSFRASKS